MKLLKKEQSLESLAIGTTGVRNAIENLKKKQSLESLAIGTISTKNGIQLFEEETKAGKPCD